MDAFEKEHIAYIVYEKDTGNIVVRGDGNRFNVRLQAHGDENLQVAEVAESVYPSVTNISELDDYTDLSESLE